MTVMPLREEYLSEEAIIREARDLVNEKGQDRGTPAERLVECAGRACYDSYGAGRPSSEYHKHIMEVDHGSVTEHATLSFFISAVSRGLTHELVRHRVGVAISQRSTRYVDESSSPYIHHPLVEKFLSENPPERQADVIGEVAHRKLQGAHVMCRIELTNDADRKMYDVMVEILEAWLIGRGVDKFTARKQARGAARGYLGNALQTELVWTCNIRTLRTAVLNQRAKAAADAEIRLFANALYEAALPYWPSYLGEFKRRECPDGLGFELYDPTSAVEQLREAKLKIKELEAKLSAAGIGDDHA